MHHTKLKQLQRQERILQTLKKLDYLTTTQIMLLHGLKTPRNARATLQGLSDKLNSFKDGENVYYLNAKGREVVDCQKVRKGAGNLRHFIMRNGIYIKYGCPATWRNEIKITSKGATKKDTVTNVADALFKRDNVWHIVEVDNVQRMPRNRQKIAKYKELTARGTFGDKAPVFIWVTNTESRRKQIKELFGDGYNCIVYLYGDIT